MNTVRNVLQEKGSQVWTVSPQTIVYEALVLMADKNVGALLVMEGERERVVGVFSERDYARKGVLKGHIAKDTKVEELMSTNIHTIGPEATMADCMALFTEKRIRHIPILENGKLIGLVSIGDVVHEVIAEQKSTIKAMGDYILGVYGE